MTRLHIARIGSECALDCISFVQVVPPDALDPEIIVRTSMDLDRTEILTVPGTPAPTPKNGGARTWLESVSAGMRTVEAVIRELSQNDVPVLVVAEHGSGKAAAAARIHALSSRGSEEFRVFQGRDASEEVLAECDGSGGTIYLQEVGDLTAAAQKELVRQVGLNGDAERRVPRFICGTSR